MDVAGLPPADRHVDGVVDMILDATENFAAPLTDERLFGWHRALSDRAQRHAQDHRRRVAHRPSGANAGRVRRRRTATRIL
jgi:hypothetical protein